jgi:hypothetical protein
LEQRAGYKILLVNLQTRGQSKEVDTDGDIILKWSSKKYGKNVLSRFILLRIYIYIYTHTHIYEICVLVNWMRNFGFMKLGKLLSI